LTLVRPETMRSSTSVRYSCGSIPLSFADYAARRTMPNGFGTMRCLGEFAGRRAGILLFHSA
jgi:hypothetical protein